MRNFATRLTRSNTIKVLTGLDEFGGFQASPSVLCLAEKLLQTMRGYEDQPLLVDSLFTFLDHPSVRTDVLVQNRVKQASAHLWSRVTSSEFEVFVEARKWIKTIEWQIKNLPIGEISPIGAFVYIELNTGKAVIAIDARR